MRAGSDLALVVTHEFDAPRALMFRAWTQQQQHAAQWWGPLHDGVLPDRCATRRRRSPGDAGPDGVLRTDRGVYREVTPDRVVFSYAWDDVDLNPGHETQATVTLEEIGTRSRMTLV